MPRILAASRGDAAGFFFSRGTVWSFLSFDTIVKAAIGGLHGRQDPYRARGRRLPAPGRASAHAHRRAEHRYDESRWILPQLPVELDEGRGRRQGRADDQGPEP